MTGKQFWKSKTLWFNVLALVVILADSLGFADFVGDPLLEEYGLVLITIVNVLLRFVTKERVEARFR